MSNKYPPGHAMNNPDIGTKSSEGLRGLPGVLPKPKPKLKLDPVYKACGGKIYKGR
jgi:hypothetical protein